METHEEITIKKFADKYESLAMTNDMLPFSVIN
jgi:hypothetical protein